MKGHYSPNPTWTNEVWGLDVLHTENDRYLSCSVDATLRVYSASERKCKGSISRGEGWGARGEANRDC